MKKDLTIYTGLKGVRYSLPKYLTSCVNAGRQPTEKQWARARNSLTRVEQLSWNGSDWGVDDSYLSGLIWFDPQEEIPLSEVWASLTGPSFYHLREWNSWEREAWSFFFPTTGWTLEQALQAASLARRDAGAYHFDAAPRPLWSIDEGHNNGYMPAVNFIDHEIDPEALVAALKARTKDDPLYKGGLLRGIAAKKEV